ncbi:Ppx/GppA phosphatase [Psychromonas sp. CNPT3]|uniref:Ppx/GppA phosphatase family protein n=1 Tax=Psychromonas sp. CNPT3 TaxID=314282 RepID=UPI00006E9E71|nr:guanosine-5'-triphosphate,3'-diphosphate pyrophosphatase [Psychromonas sp. CNPT3]AGH80283.1 Ppx/GppA phosphatase [Psychromonas sp. CNPT3]
MDKRYTIIDLGSNSFHMLTVQKTKNGFSVYSKHKEKVRLALGLDAQNNLNLETMQRGWQCLRQFKTELDKLQPSRILITATAALRLAKNKTMFINKAENILQTPINLISGIEEAKTIYQGVVFTEHVKVQLLVIDIGGASTELIIGKDRTVISATSLDMGCVTWQSRYFNDGKLNSVNFENAIIAAKKVLSPQAEDYKQQGWSLCMGASGTIQAVNEINAIQNICPHITASLLKQIQAQLIECKTLNNINIVGLKQSRIAVFSAGLTILIALFECLNIKQLDPSQGALREGLISRLFNEENLDTNTTHNI